jgi:hypothetical protein
MTFDYCSMHVIYFMILGFCEVPLFLEQVHNDVLDEVQMLQHRTKYCTHSMNNLTQIFNLWHGP